MIGEFNLYGVYFPWLLVLAVIGVGVSLGARKLLAGVGAYRYIWHPALFDLALFVLILFGLQTLASHVLM